MASAAWSALLRCRPRRSPSAFPARSLASAAERVGRCTAGEKRGLSALPDLLSEVAAANERGRGRWELRGTAQKGWGVFALKTFFKDEKLFGSQALETRQEPDEHTIQKGFGEHIYMNLPARFINHSCDANTGIRDNDQAYDFFALREIREGEELTWDYEAAEFESISIPGECLCGSDRCRKQIKGFKFRYDVIRDQYGAYYPEYLKDYVR